MNIASLDFAKQGETDSRDDFILQYINESIIGSDAVISTPFGKRQILYADYTASGRALTCIEEYILKNVLPLYGNTHTTSSAVGYHTTRLREEARDVVLQCVGGDCKDDAVLFCGSGSTAAIAKMASLLSCSQEWRQCMRSGRPPLVLVGPYEHHSNLLPWRESGACVIAVRESANGAVDIQHLEQLLQLHAKTALKIGTFSAASNVTGIIADTFAIAAALHKHNALAFFDYASGGPYLDIDMNPPPSPGGSPAHKDAIFLSPHKFVGGVATPGVLVVKRALARRLARGRPPTQPGGGTVVYVLEHDHAYHDAVEDREEGGTPDIVGSVRCALAFRLKAAVGPRRILAREAAHWSHLRAALAACPRIRMLGDLAAPRLAVLSFNVRHGGQYLHHGFVAALLNDLFGIQARAGCACAGPYAYRLLGIGSSFGTDIRAALLQGDELVKPGFVRVGASYFLSDAAVGFLADAVALVAEHGWRLLPLYAVRPGSAEWQHRDAQPAPISGEGPAAFPFGVLRGGDPPGASACVRQGTASSCSSCPKSPTDAMLYIDSDGSGDKSNLNDVVGTSSDRQNVVWTAYLAAARSAMAAAARVAAEENGLAARLAAEEVAGDGWLRSPEGRRLRWFPLPSEAAALLRSGGSDATLPPDLGLYQSPFLLAGEREGLEDEVGTLTRAGRCFVKLGWGR